jgi:hypothetical protein
MVSMVDRRFDLGPGGGRENDNDGMFPKDVLENEPLLPFII